MRIVICLDVEDGVAPVEAARDVLALTGARVTLLHVADPREREPLRRPGPPGLVRPRPPKTESAIAADEHKLLRSVLEQARWVLGQAGSQALDLAIERGPAERAIVRYLAQESADTCVLARRPRWREAKESGPHSVGKVARFVIDHAPCPVLVLR